MDSGRSSVWRAKRWRRICSYLSYNESDRKNCRTVKEKRLCRYRLCRTYDAQYGGKGRNDPSIDEDDWTYCVPCLCKKGGKAAGKDSTTSYRRRGRRRRRDWKQKRSIRIVTKVL